MRRLASLNRQLTRAVERGWEDDQRILREEIDKIMARAEGDEGGPEGRDDR